VAYKNPEDARAYARLWYQRNREAVIKRTARNKAALSDARRLIFNARNRVGKENVKLQPEDVVVPTHCPVLGLPLYRNKRFGGANSPSLDRIDPSKGYTKDNVHVISHRANTIKNNATPEELAAVALFFAPHLVLPVE
jgi:hypothetical protein